MIGKVPPDGLADHVFARTGLDDDDVVWGPSYGEDAAAIDLGDRVLVASVDPISLAADRLGRLGVFIACNDVAASGADPRWVLVVLLLPSADEDQLDSITRQLDEASRSAGVAIVGGHTEYAPSLDRPMLSLTCLGLAERYVPSSGAKPEDRVVLTKTAGIEGTAIIATDFRDQLEELSETVIRSAASFYDQLSVIEEAGLLREWATAMHDPTEGGLVDGLYELAMASGVEITVDRIDVPVREETTLVCDAVGVDPLRTFGSGALLATVPPARVDDALASLKANEIPGEVIGTVRQTDQPGLVLDGDQLSGPLRDDLYSLWEE